MLTVKSDAYAYLARCEPGKPSRKYPYRCVGSKNYIRTRVLIQAVAYLLERFYRVFGWITGVWI